MDLLPHPSSDDRGLRIGASVGRSGTLVTFTFTLAGETANLRIPAPAAPERTDNLWRMTCFEAFVGGAGDSYVELNFAPSGKWAAYSFNGYREGMRPLELAEPPRIAFDGSKLTATLPLDAPPGAPLGLSAVIEHGDGSLSYWALAHPGPAPDFHHRDCFVARLA